MFQPPPPRMGLWTPGPPEFTLYWPGPGHLSGFIENLFTAQVGIQCRYFRNRIWSGRPRFHLSQWPTKSDLSWAKLGHPLTKFDDIPAFPPAMTLTNNPVAWKRSKSKNWEHLWHPVWHQCTVLPTRDISQLKQCYPIVQGSKTTIKILISLETKARVHEVEKCKMVLYMHGIMHHLWHITIILSLSRSNFPQLRSNAMLEIP